MQLKAIIKKIAKQKKVSAQLILQNYMLERFLERVSLSLYHKNFIIKGGFLIASIVGLDSRATMDMDATIKGYSVNEKTIQTMIEEIISISVADNILFHFSNISLIREGNEYNGYRVALSANYEYMSVPLKIDITTGDKITPKEIGYQYKLMLENRTISVLAYNLPTIFAEKLETVISRGDQNTRPRDYYDIFILSKLQNNRINWNTLKEAFQATIEKRGSTNVAKQYKTILEVVRNNETMKRQWNDYRKEFDYASKIQFEETCDVVIMIMDKLL